jgi:O-antigen/teichoic acid export membrane protein
MRRIPDSLLFAASPMLNAGLAFLTVPLLTWTMQAEAIAKFGLFQYSSSVLLIFVTLGLDQAFLRSINSTRALSALLRKCLTPVVAMLVIVGVAAGLVPETKFATNLYGSNAGWIILMLWINVVFLTVHRFGAQETRMDPHGGFSFLMADLLMRIPLLVMLGTLVTLQKQVPLYWIFLATIVGAALSAGVLVFRNRTTWTGDHHKFSIEGEQTTTQLVQFGAPLAVAGLMFWSIGNTGVYLTQWVHGPIEAAKLVVATSLANMAAIGQAMFSLLWLPKVYRNIDTNLRPQDIELAAHRTCVGATMVYAVVVVSLHGAQYLLGEQYRNIAPQAAALCVLPVLFCISEVTMIGLMVKRRAMMALGATASGLATSAFANLLLTIPLGGLGACMALTLSAFAFLAARTEFAGRVWQPIRRRKVYFGAALITAVGFTAPLVPATVGPITLLLLLPYLLFEKKIVLQLLSNLRKFALAK